MARFTKKNCKRQIKQSLELKKYLREQVITKWKLEKAIIIPLTIGSVKKIFPYSHDKNKIKVKLDLSNYAKRFDLKEVTCVNIPKFAKKADLDSLKLYIDILDSDKFETTPVDLS